MGGNHHLIAPSEVFIFFVIFDYPAQNGSLGMIKNQAGAGLVMVDVKIA